MGYGDVQMIDANGIRNDGRKAGDVRPISIELGVVPVADGSCRMRWGTNEVIAAIYGPMEAHPRKIQRQDRAVLDVRYNMAPFLHLIESDLVLIEEAEKLARLLRKHWKAL